MKNIKKFLSLLLVLAMVFAMSSAVFAASPSDDATVTVYVTKGMFDEGGFDRQNNTYAKVQKYLGRQPCCSPEWHIYGYGACGAGCCHY